MNKRIIVKCSDCGADVEISIKTYNANKKDINHKYRCKECLKKYFSETTKRYINSLSEEEKESRNKQLRENYILWNNNLNDEEKLELSRKLSNGQEKRWNKLSAEEKEKALKSFIDGKAKYYSTIDWDKFKQSVKNGHKSMSQIEKQKMIDKRSKSMKEYWNKIPENIRQAKMISIHDKYKEYWKNLNDEEKYHILNDMHNGWNGWHNNLSNEDKTNHMLKSIISSQGKNKFHDKFEKLINCYDYKSEYPSTNNNITHFWDYAIFKNNTLVVLIDLDGAYYHADICDYDGLHSKEEYDERRGLSIPDGVKWCIINENNFDKCFEYLLKIINLSYSEFTSTRFKEYRNMPFPQPQYTDSELLRSYEALQRMDCNDKYHTDMKLNTRLGDRIIQHFHTSLYDEAQAVWKDDNKLLKLTNEHVVYQSYLNKNKILQGLNVSEICQTKRFISPAKAKMIINKYLIEYVEIFNPDNRYSGIMIATIVLNKRFVYCENNSERLLEIKNILKFFNKYSIKTNVIYNTKQTNYQCLFTEIDDVDMINFYIEKYKCEKYIFIYNDEIIIEGI